MNKRYNPMVTKGDRDRNGNTMVGGALANDSSISCYGRTASKKSWSACLLEHKNFLQSKKQKL